MGDFLTMHMNELIFAITTFIGLIAHYCKKWIKGETVVGLLYWFGPSNRAASILTLGTAMTVIITALSNNIITQDMQFWSVVYIGLTTGYAIDSSANSDEASKQRADDNLKAQRKL